MGPEFDVGRIRRRPNSAFPDFILQLNARLWVLEAFDPYSAWLAIPAGRRPPDYYQLLGLAPLESDLFRIVTSADRQIGCVLPFLACEHAQEARRLLEELLTAKGFLITPTAKALYDAEFLQRLATSGLPEDAALLDLLASAPPAERNRPRADPPALAPPAYEAEAPPVIAPPGMVEDVARATLLAPPGAAFASLDPASHAGGVTMATAAPPLDINADDDAQPPEPETAQMPDSAEDLDAVRLDTRRRPRNTERRSPWAGPAIAFVVSLAAVGLAAGVAWQGGFRRPLGAVDSGPTPPRDDAASRSSTPVQSAPMQPTSVQPTTEQPTPERAPPDATQISKLKELLALAREALAARDLAAADKQLEAASAHASSPELLARLEAVRLLRDYVDGFWKAVRESAKTLKGGEEFTVRGKVVAIVDARRDEIVLRAAGQNRTYKLNELPPHMATALAERWLDKDDANSKVYVGAFWLVDPKVERSLAREKLAEAANAGAADAMTLTKLLDAPG